jgi:hypothetical protein
MTARTIQALRNLATRPGTEAEGLLAEKILSLVDLGYEDIPSSKTASQLFPVGTRVYYNYWAYAPNCPAVVVGYCTDTNWIRLKFDHLKARRNVPIHSVQGWHLFTSPIDYDKLCELDIRGGMEHFEARPVAGEVTR